MNSTQKNRRLGRLITGAAVLLLVAGGTALGFGVWGNTPPPQPPDSAGIPAPSALVGTAPSAAAGPTSGAAAPSPSTDAAAPVGPVLDKSTPTHIDIPSIGVDSALTDLGLNDDGSLEVPPFEKDSPAGWYRGSPTPGEVGPSIILGHVDTYKAGPVVFYRLGDMREGDEISVTRKDDTVAVFRVDRVESFPKANFPELEVYGNTNSAQVRLITCGGEYKDHQYVNDIVVFATLVSSHPA